MWPSQQRVLLLRDVSYRGITHVEIGWTLSTRRLSLSGVQAAIDVILQRCPLPNGFEAEAESANVFEYQGPDMQDVVTSWLNTLGQHFDFVAPNFDLNETTDDEADEFSRFVQLTIPSRQS